MTNISDVIGDYPAFIKLILSQLKDAGFDLSDFSQLDHICYRTVSLENYQDMKERLAVFGEDLGEKLINNRPISIFRLKSPLKVDGWRIDCIELPAPRSGSLFAEGLEHAEFVIYDSLEAFLEKYADKDFDMRSATRGINPEIGLKLNKYAAKFHLSNISSVLYIEEKLGIGEVKD